MNHLILLNSCPLLSPIVPGCLLEMGLEME